MGALTLNKKQKGGRKPLESSFEESFAELLRRHGIESWHLSARDPGWPDRFCHTGDWIEFKVLDALTDDQLEPEQHGRMRQLATAGVRVWYCAWYQGGTILCRYPFAIDLKDRVTFTREDALKSAMRQGGFQ